jgi:hypothetical protein
MTDAEREVYCLLSWTSEQTRLMYAASILFLLCDVQLFVLRLMCDKSTRKRYSNKLEYREAVEERRLHVRYVVKDDSSGEKKVLGAAPVVFTWS